ncbi:hypothetical protein [Ruegeria sp. HKCCC1038]|uniref:hypothetical protein n=1 Tax=Ruegeria sp. HKCCC1038 TaxID=2682982 RepID=UPI0020C3DAB3|nr:hypothetical protein [Ruegeria sp. HKCCC1038]
MRSDQWHRLNEIVAETPVLGGPASWFGDMARLVLGVVLFAALIVLHPIVIGVSAL